MPNSLHTKTGSVSNQSDDVHRSEQSASVSVKFVLSTQNYTIVEFTLKFLRQMYVRSLFIITWMLPIATRSRSLKSRVYIRTAFWGATIGSDAFWSVSEVVNCLKKCIIKEICDF